MLRFLSFSPATHVRRTIAALAASSGMHALLLAALAVVVVKAHERADAPAPPGAGLTVPITLGAADGAGIDGSLLGATLPQSAQSEPARTDGAGTVPSARFAAGSAEHAERALAGMLPAEPRGLDRLQLAGTEAAGEGAKGEGDAAAGGGGGVPGGKGHSFFGLEASGDKVVFVVDISGSMSGRRFYRARTELRESIEGLRENQEFFVIFFANDALPMPSDKLLPATSENIERTVNWLKYIECGGGTNPLPGLLMALRLQPDAIYLMTDGKFDPQVAWEVAQAQPARPIPIYTISFATRAAERLLKQIAAETGGSYRFAR